MTQTEIIRFVAESTKNTIKDTSEIVDEFVDYLRNSLKEHEAVTIPGLGKFTVRQRDARTARNPRTGETIEVPAKFAVAFKPTDTLKELVNE